MGTYGTDRQIRSMGRPVEFEIMEQNMRENINRIRLKCESLLAQQVDDLKQQLESKFTATES